MTDKPQTIDYTSPMWGHAVQIVSVSDDKLSARLAGHGPMQAFCPIFNMHRKERTRALRDGDFILIKVKAGTARLRLSNVEYKRDPHDMWFADAEVCEEEAA